MFESEEPEDWHKKFHHDMALNDYGHDKRITDLEKRLAALELYSALPTQAKEYKPVDKSVEYNNGSELTES